MVLDVERSPRAPDSTGSNMNQSRSPMAWANRNRSKAAVLGLVGLVALVGGTVAAVTSTQSQSAANQQGASTQISNNVFNINADGGECTQSTAVFRFQVFENAGNADANDVEDNLFLQVFENNNQAMFALYSPNELEESSSDFFAVTTVYFDVARNAGTPELTADSVVQTINGGTLSSQFDVSYEFPSTGGPPNPPGDNGFDTNVKAHPNNPSPKKGLNPGQAVVFGFDLNSESIEDVIDRFQNGQYELAIHVQNLATPNGEGDLSASFAIVPESCDVPTSSPTTSPTSSPSQSPTSSPEPDYGGDFDDDLLVAALLDKKN